MAGKKGDTSLLVNSAGNRYIYSDQVGHLLRKANQQASAIFQKYSATPQLTSVQISMLFALATHGPMPQSKLSKLASIDASTMTGVVERLRDRNLIETTSEESDKRKVIIALSDEGRDVVSKTVEVGCEITEAILTPLNDIERVALLALLKKLTHTGS